MLKPVLPLLITATFTLSAFISQSEAYLHMRSCGGEYRSFSIARLQCIVDDSSALHDDRIAAIDCLIEHGTEGVRILSNNLQRDYGNTTFATIKALGFIKDREVIDTLLRLIDRIDADHGSASSLPLSERLCYKRSAIEKLVKVAMTAFHEPDFMPGWVTSDGENLFYSKGVRPKRSDAMRVLAVLKTIKDSQHSAMTPEESAVIQEAIRGIRKIEERITLLEQHGPRLIQRETYVVDGWKPTYNITDASRNIRSTAKFSALRTIFDKVVDGMIAAETVDSLETVLNDPSDVIRWRAIVLLGLSRNPSAIAAINNSLQHDPSLKVRSQAAKSLKRLAED